MGCLCVLGRFVIFHTRGRPGLWRNRPDSNRQTSNPVNGLAIRCSTSYAYCSVYLFRGMSCDCGFAHCPRPFVHAQGWRKVRDSNPQRITVSLPYMPNQNCTGAFIAVFSLSPGSTFYRPVLIFERRPQRGSIKKSRCVSARLFPCCSDGDKVSYKFGYFQGHLWTLTDSYGHKTEKT